MDALAEDMKLEGTSNDLNQNQFMGGDMANLLGDGVPGYETTGVDGTDDDIAEQQEASIIPMTPSPKLIP
ncbi:hypothetical protein [Legionella maioricensis]|uniref:Uncharacterized protein n=1 Tax=Legionella maioricensis TaxID=2896528 RepID=A0A9X2D1Q7_9GAMM|nr:hypothetical protein [Legionella maioricensis]MCL9684811.1 hypothetical protein [Legionella maioricensis]MCL9687787.1 hypothetical protein [Legionella maioricensis]